MTNWGQMGYLVASGNCKSIFLIHNSGGQQEVYVHWRAVDTVIVVVVGTVLVVGASSIFFAPSVTVSLIVRRMGFAISGVISLVLF